MKDLSKKWVVFSVGEELYAVRAVRKNDLRNILEDGMLKFVCVAVNVTMKKPQSIMFWRSDHGPMLSATPITGYKEHD